MIVKTCANLTWSICLVVAVALAENSNKQKKLIEKIKISTRSWWLIDWDGILTHIVIVSSTFPRFVIVIILIVSVSSITPETTINNKCQKQPTASNSIQYEYESLVNKKLRLLACAGVFAWMKRLEQTWMTAMVTTVLTVTHLIVQKKSRMALWVSKGDCIAKVTFNVRALGDGGVGVGGSGGGC